MAKESAPAMEVPAVLHVIKVNWQDRDHRYPGYYPAPKRKPADRRSIRSILTVVACAALLGVIFGIISCLGA